ncbi:hypothetical protein VTK26DRAFT_7177 [Humicola hyalothermophila]
MKEAGKAGRGKQGRSVHSVLLVDIGTQGQGCYPLVRWFDDDCMARRGGKQRGRLGHGMEWDTQADGRIFVYFTFLLFSRRWGLLFCLMGPWFRFWSLLLMGSADDTLPHCRSFSGDYVCISFCRISFPVCVIRLGCFACIGGVESGMVVSI